ncbi:hypothetical protein TNCV_2708081 [Trichonephila clavipes]|nr:hypothetical protein TNCV_2708081 [Trichonephila clavipes]
MHETFFIRAVGSLVLRASDCKPESLGSMPDATKFPPSTHEYVLVKSVGSKVLRAVAVETTSTGDWRIFPSPPVPCLNFGGGYRWCHHLSSLREFYRVKSYCHMYGAQG